MRHAGAIRIDHVLGLMRLFVIPRGWRRADGAYVRYPFDGMLAVVAEEKPALRLHRDRRRSRHRAGEISATRSRATGLWSYLVMLFEREHDGSFRAPERYPANALATFNTHDLRDLQRLDVAGRTWPSSASIGVDPGESDEDREQFARGAASRRSRSAPGSASRRSQLSGARRRRGWCRSPSRTCWSMPIRSTCRARSSSTRTGEGAFRCRSKQSDGDQRHAYASPRCSLRPAAASST